ncbi:MAG: IgGFc-binding protein, partial [Deltaproteobacteria bacterium]|nr:IgGFc-binding protein [Deltaproteobacteria bacterium]
DHRLAGATALVLSGPVGPFVHAVAVEDETHLTFVPNYPVATSAGVFQAGQTIQVTLGRHQSFYARATALPGDFSGASQTSDRPVAVFSGVPIADMNGCVNPADPKGTRCDPVFEQIPPVDSLGRAFVATQSLGKTADLVRVVATEDATEVRVNGVLSSLISRGQFTTVPIPTTAKVVHVTTTRPALGVQSVYGDLAAARAARAELPALRTRRWAPSLHRLIPPPRRTQRLRRLDLPRR